MGLIMKKDDSEDNEYIDGIEVVGRGEGPNGDDEVEHVEIHEGLTAEDISGKTAAAEAERELEADPELLDAEAEEGGAAEGGAEDADADAEDADVDADAEGADAANAGEADGEPEAEGVEDSESEAGTSVDSSTAAPAAKPRPARPKKTRMQRAMMGKHKYFIAGALVAVIVAGVSGYFLGSGGFGSKGVSAPVFAESELDATVATWKFKGASHKISAREAIESQYSLDSVKDEDGNYPAPSADAVLAYVRNRILLEEASKQGIELSDEELSSSAETSLGTSDFSAIADQYGVSEDQAKQIVREQGTIQKLYQSVMDDAPAMPKAPAEPESGDENEAKAEYAAYIIDLAGKEWDAEAGTWAKLDGAYATALAGEEITPESATYAQAQKAYAVAYQQYMLESQGANAKWTSYVNELFGEADVELFGLYA
ncbi:hypothetical protein [Collinsella intestinalis]|uniref:Uncharacterized protein n=1 Tax=Collinsella intestinalis TaxID=147207 RepID=A0A414NEI3_9ACTN|nr:hypothetical protein [Collinsella intestinalis]RHF37295.1 hypothetical protein DW682_06715 [Collinsella intestinalis]